MNAVLVLLTGFFVRLVLPILVTALVVLALRALDQRWQMEAGKNHNQDDLPCWQKNRLPNGYLKEECLGCDEFLSAPIPQRNK
jgi:hypothetical protein